MAAKPRSRPKKAAAKKSAAKTARATSRAPARKPARKAAAKKSARPARTSSRSSGATKASAKTAARPRASASKAAPAVAVGKLSQIALTATDLDAATAFYADVLGLKLAARFDEQGFAFFSLGGGARLMLSASASQASLYFSVDDLNAAVRTLKRRGVTFLQKPMMVHRDDAGDFGKRGGEEWMAFFNDPSGNLLALVEKR